MTVGFLFGLFYGGSKQDFNVGNIKNMNAFLWFMKISGNNTIAFLFLSSCILFGKKIAYLFYIINGSILGLLISNFKSFLALSAILPHGIIEMGCYIFAGYFLICYIIEKDFKYIKFAGITYLGILIAAIIESAITPKLVLFLYQ